MYIKSWTTCSYSGHSFSLTNYDGNSDKWSSSCFSVLFIFMQLFSLMAMSRLVNGKVIVSLESIVMSPEVTWSPFRASTTTCAKKSNNNRPVFQSYSPIDCRRLIFSKLWKLHRKSQSLMLIEKLESFMRKKLKLLKLLKLILFYEEIFYSSHEALLLNQNSWL